MRKTGDRIIPKAGHAHAILGIAAIWAALTASYKRCQSYLCQWQIDASEGGDRKKNKVVPEDRIELPTQRFSVACSTN